MLEVVPKIAPIGYPANEHAAGVALLQTLDVSHIIRSAAIGTLADVSSKGSRALVAAAVGLLRDSDSVVRAAAARALLLVARTDDEETLKALAPLLEESSEARTGESVRNRAATLMTSVSRSTNVLVKNTFEKHLDNLNPYIRVTAIQGLVDMMENDHHPQVPCNLVLIDDINDDMIVKRMHVIA
jgi:HEAT repeat protein